MRLLACMIAGWLVASGARAADLEVRVATPGGKPVPDAVVTVFPAAGQGAGPIRFSWPYRVFQQDMRFHPFVLIVPQGAQVAFPNKDGVRHHVYSFSPAKTFELKLYGKDESRSVLFDKLGVVALGCNIHDSMVGFIKVVDTRYAAKADADGRLIIAGLPPGKAMMRVWHPYLKGRDNEIVRAIEIGGVTERQSVTADVRVPAHRSHGY